MENLSNAVNQSSPAARQGIKLERGKIVVRKVTANSFKPELDQAEIAQVITKHYPSVRLGSDRADMLFDRDDFTGIGDKPYDETRVTWIAVPKMDNLTPEEKVEMVQKKLDSLVAAGKRPTIYKILTNDVMDLLDSAQVYAMNNQSEDFKNTDKSTFEDRLIVKRSEDQVPVLYAGRKQYSQRYFSTDFKEDIDKRVQPDSAIASAEASQVRKQPDVILYEDQPVGAR